MTAEAPQEHSVLVVALEEPLDRERLDAHRHEVESWLAMGGARVVVSLGTLDFINSAGLGFLIRMRKRLKESGGRLVLSQPSSFVQKALRVLDLDELFHVFDSDEAAVRALS